LPKSLKEDDMLAGKFKARRDELKDGAKKK